MQTFIETEDEAASYNGPWAAILAHKDTLGPDFQHFNSKGRCGRANGLSA